MVELVLRQVRCKIHFYNRCNGPENIEKIGTPPSEYATFTGSSVFRQGIRRSRTTVQADDATNAEETGGTGASGGGSRGGSFIRFTRRQLLVHLSTRPGQGDA